jgi:hypothetical protein
MPERQLPGTKARISVTRTTDMWNIACAGILDEPGADELERIVRVCLAEWPMCIRLDLTSLLDISDDGAITIGELVLACKERGVPLKLFLSMETPVQVIVDLDDQIRERSESDDVGLGGQGPASVRFERGGIVVSV